MPGTIRVSVLEAIELPKALTDGTSGTDVTAKVTLGPKLFKTEPGIADGGRIESWNSDFAFPVMNLRDKLEIAICDSEDRSVTQTAIEIPSIIQKGTRDEFVALGAGGRIHLKMSFVLSDEERRKIETMRVAALKRREEERQKRTVVFQTVQTTVEKESMPAVTITEVDDSTTEESNEPKDVAPVSAVVIMEIDDSTTDEKKDPKETANGPVGFDSTTDERKDSKETENGNGPLGFGSTTKPLAPKPMFDYARAIGMQKSRSFKRTNSFSRRSEAKANNGGMIFEGQRWDGYQATRSRYIQMGMSEIQAQSGQGQRSEARSGPGARWAQKTGLETKWTSPEQARRIVREDFTGQVTDHNKVRAKIVELIKAAAGSHDHAYGDYRSFQEHHTLTDSIGAVLHKVVGGAAMLLAALLMTCPPAR